MEQHPRLHAMSVWLHLIPRLHTAGANNIFPAHNAFTGHDDPSLFTGVVRPSSFSHGYQVFIQFETLKLQTSRVENKTFFEFEISRHSDRRDGKLLLLWLRNVDFQFATYTLFCQIDRWESLFFKFKFKFGAGISIIKELVSL